MRLRRERLRAAVALTVAAGLGYGCTLLTDLDVLTRGQPATDASDDGAREAPSGDAAPIGDDGGAGRDSGSSYRDILLADRPVAYWRLGEAPGEITAHDETGHGNDGTYINVNLGAPGAIAGDPNTAVELNGSGSIVVGDKLDFVGNVPFSIEAWGTLASMGDQYFVGKGQSDTLQRYQLYVWGNGIRFDRNGDTFAPCIAFEGDGGALADRQFHHYVATYDKVTMRIYVDGVLVQPCVVQSNLIDMDGSLTLGPLGGRLDEVAIYDRVLPAPNIKAHFDAARAGR